jgi:hypothetical protein
MNNKIASIFKGYLETLSWADKVAGLVQTVSIRTADSTAKSYPISCDVTADACISGAYQDLCPNSKKKSVLYFEDKGVSMVARQGTRLKFKSSMRLVGWVNLKLIQEAECDADTIGCGSIGDYVIDVINLLPNSPIQTADFISIMVSDIAEAERDVSIFSKYTYSETGVQYLMFPYGYFALDLSIDFTIPCVPGSAPVVIVPGAVDNENPVDNEDPI